MLENQVTPETHADVGDLTEMMLAVRRHLGADFQLQQFEIGVLRRQWRKSGDSEAFAQVCKGIQRSHDNLFIFKDGTLTISPFINDEDWRLVVAWWHGASREVVSRKVVGVEPTDIARFNRFCEAKGWRPVTVASAKPAASGST